MDAEAALNSLFTLWKKVQERFSSNETPTAPLLLSESRKRAKQFDVKQINDMVYLVHNPPEKEKPQLEIVFFHGLELKQTKEAHVKTWMSRDDSEFWLQTWLADSFPNSRILTISYDSFGPLDMFRMAENLLSSLTMDEVSVGKAGCPVVLVGHCLGGLILKELCVFASDKISRNNREKLGVQRVQCSSTGLLRWDQCSVTCCTTYLKVTVHPLKSEVLKASSARTNADFHSLKALHK